VGCGVWGMVKWWVGNAPILASPSVLLFPLPPLSSSYSSLSWGMYVHSLQGMRMVWAIVLLFPVYMTSVDCLSKLCCVTHYSIFSCDLESTHCFHVC
jgi:hypothetical protein